MQFGSHAPTEVKARGGQSPMAVFTRGLKIGGGTQWRFAFPNGFGASVIDDGYGSEDGLYEVAVLDSDGHITHQTPITDDVLGYLSEAKVVKTLDKIAALTDSSVAREKVRRLTAEVDERRAKIAALEAEIAASAS